MGEKEPLVQRMGCLREFCILLESTTTYYTNGYIQKKATL